MKDNEIYALVLKGTVDIQGLIAIKHEPTYQSTYITWMCTASHNNPQLVDMPKYAGVGGHLFAIAGTESQKVGFNGEVFGFAANQRVLEHYVEKLHATPIQMLHPYHFAIFDNNMQELLETYTYELTDEEI